MKKINIVYIILGLLLFAVSLIITIYSEELPSLVKTVVFIIVSYTALGIFSLGWVRIFRKKI